MRHRISSTRVAVCLLAVTACTAPNLTQPTIPPVVSAPAVPAVATVHEDVGAPVQIRVSGPPLVVAGQTIEVRATITRTWAAVTPLQLDVEVPKGTRLVSGPPHETLTDGQAPHFERVWRVHIDALPSQDLVVTLDWQTSGAGYHAAIPYRFGRPEPRLATATAHGLPIVLPNGVSLGEPVLMGPETVRPPR